MNIPDKDQILRVSFWISVAILFVAPLEVFNLLLEVSHLLFEWIEITLDFFIEVLFDTSLHNTQIVVFYILFATISYGVYRIWRGFPNFYDRQKANFSVFLTEERENVLDYWHESMVNKFKLSSLAVGFIFLLFI